MSHKAQLEHLYGIKLTGTFLNNIDVVSLSTDDLVSSVRRILKYSIAVLWGSIDVDRSIFTKDQLSIIDDVYGQLLLYTISPKLAQDVEVEIKRQYNSDIVKRMRMLFNEQTSPNPLSPASFSQYVTWCGDIFGV